MCINSSKRLVVSVSYGDYTQGGGGTDKVILSHQHMFNNAGINVLYIYNYRGNENGKYAIWHVIYNGVSYKFCTIRQIETIIQEHVKEKGTMEGFFIHHLMNSNMRELKELFEFCPAPIKVYLHDYMTICPTKGLIYSDSVFCGMSSPKYEKCVNCEELFKKNVDRLCEIQEFFREFSDRISFIAPSDVAKAKWLETYPQYEDKVKVIYHQKVRGYYHGNMEPLVKQVPLKIAFVGYQKGLKGWKYWVEAVSKINEQSNNYKFYQFGWGNEKLSFVQQVKIDFKENLNAMVYALREEGIDCAILWSTWPETYAYTYYEAWAANAFIITNSVSGNICAQVLKNKNGFVLDNLDALYEVFTNEDKLRESVNLFKRNKNYGPMELVENDELLKLVKPITIELGKKESYNFFHEIMVSIYKKKYDYLRMKRYISKIIKNR